ncbi:hypothetical protein CJ010_24155 [Azoarcus sp. DD4]|uniref:TonB-dependent receptor n=1 Tax=Azoarcus sp. DD4 TaxID=2027405 RepID=UPI00112DAFE9|nr:TonB-dependent receptor [Azoarcus sp. DD4]QDF99406.1 hypothetical protein CJ010_24155 [Azoarcus sp. DD4]
MIQAPTRAAQLQSCLSTYPSVPARRHPAPAVLAVLLVTLCGGALAEQTLTPVVVSDTAESPQSAWFAPGSGTPATEYVVGEEGIALFGGKGASNPYSMIQALPGVQMQSIDAWGLVNQQGGNKGLRVRGETASHGANGTVEGVPLNGPGPGPGYLFLLDAENIASVSLMQGAVPPDRFSLYDAVGQLDTRILWPRAQFGGTVSVGVGQDNYRRLFARVDSGALPGGTAFFLSASTTSADKWRGSGESPERRETFAAGLTRQLGALDVKLLLAHNEMAADNYKGLTYAQSKDESLFDDIDYDPVPTGSSAAARTNWQGYNRQSFKTTAFLAEIGYPLGEDSRLVAKPFYAEEEGSYWYASGNVVRKWMIDHSTYGLTTELQTRAADTALKFGYGFVSMAPPGPPTLWKQYTPTASGGLNFAGWAMLTDVTRRHDLHNLFAVADRDFGPLHVKVGLRYVKDILPSIEYYNTTGVGDVSPGAARDQSSGVIAARSVKSAAIEEWAPYLGLRYALSPHVDIKASIGSNLGTPAFDAFQSAPVAGLSKQQVWDNNELEIADTVDLGARVRFGRGYVEPVLYYTRYDNKGVAIYDPLLKASYIQNVGKARQYGLLLAGGWEVQRGFNLFGSLSWLRSEFTEDLRTAATTYRNTQGKQLPDVPTLTASLGAAWSWGKFTLSPVVHHMGTRYANVEHTQTMSAYTVTNVDLSWRDTTPWGALKATLAVVNLFDVRYIGYNNANETSDGSSFYPGAPRTLMGKLSVDF